MGRGIDVSTITRAERWVFAAGIALFLNALIPYWYRIETPRETFLHNGGLFGYGLAAALAGFASAAIVVLRHTRTPATFKDHSIHVMLGLIAVGTLAAHGAQREALWIGFWVEAAFAAGLVAAGAMRIRERRRGWI